MPEITNIESKTKDRKITLGHYPFTGSRVLTIEETEGTYESVFAYISPKGARDLIDALEPFAAEKPEPGADINWGPQIGGTMNVYKQLDNLGLKTGDLVRITRPSEEKVVVPIEIGPYGAVKAEIAGQVHFLGDRANGHPLGDHDWLLEFEAPKVRPLYDQYLELAPGTRFKTNKLATSIFVKIDDDQVVRIRSGETVVMRFDKERGHGGLPHWKTVGGTYSHELEVL